MADAENLLCQLLHKIAKKIKSDDYTVKIRSLNSGGGNFTSLLYNATISSPNQDDLKLFAKISALSEQMGSISTKQFFETEVLFYGTIFPKYREYEERYNFLKEERLVLPKYYGGITDSSKDVIVLEDLTNLGYVTSDRFKCFDWEYASKCISGLANYHALSILFQRENPEITKVIEKIDLGIPIVNMKGFINKLISHVTEATAEENRGRLSKFLEEKMTEEYMAVFYKPSRKLVLTHGDFKPNNVLQRTNENGELELAYIDFQFIQRGNPVTDLMYFLISGSDEEFREKHLDEYFQHYYAEFSKTLRRLEIDPDEVYTKEDFDDDVQLLLPFGMLLAVTILPLIAIDEVDAPNLEEDIDIENYDLKLSDNFKKRFNAIVNDYIRMGIL